MEKRHIIEAIARVWDTTTTAGKFKLSAGLFMIIIASGGVGYWIGTLDTSHRLATLEAKYERKLTESRKMVSKFIRKFSADEWVKAKGRGSQLYIPFAEHKVNNPIITVQQKEKNGNWQEVGVEIEKDEFNNVTISIGTDGFDGQVVLK